MDKEDKELSKVIDIIVRNALPVKIFLFGSRAMGNANDRSDYDIFVVVNDRIVTRAVEKKLYYLMAKERVRIPVDLRVENLETFERLKSNQYLIYYQVNKYGRTIYEQESSSPAVA